MRIAAHGLILIKQFEGFSAVPYVCPAGYLTIGYGHVMTKAERATLSRVSTQQADNFLITDVRIAERAVSQFITVALTQNQFDALVSFTFNLGAGCLQRSTLRRVLNRGDVEAVPVQLRRYVWAGGRKLPGLVRRRAAEAMLFNNETAG
jgi:lysozyme